jgi:hypothetical protein
LSSSTFKLTSDTASSVRAQRRRQSRRTIDSGVGGLLEFSGTAAYEPYVANRTLAEHA